MAKSWFVLRVQSGREGTAKEALERRVKTQGMENVVGRIVVPSERVSEIRGGEKRVRERKIYPGYIMVEIETAEDGSISNDAWFLVRETPGVGDFLGTRDKPSPMTSDEVAKILGEVGRKEEAPKLQIGFQEGARVRIKEGHFENFEGVVDSVQPTRGIVKVVVTIFGRPTAVELEYWKIEPV
jgi:transcription termination/antitermination protein NusG